jgi:uncharacterized protein YqeY
MLVDQLKERIKQALKDKRDVEKEVLRVALGEIQTGEGRTGKAASDEDALAVIRKLVKSNEETLALTTDATQQRVLDEELTVLRSLLPQTLDEESIVAALAPLADAIRAAGNDGQATGIAMKHLKAGGAAVEGKDVASAVKRMRA